MGEVGHNAAVHLQIDLDAGAAELGIFLGDGIGIIQPAVRTMLPAKSRILELYMSSMAGLYGLLNHYTIKAAAAL